MNKLKVRELDFEIYLEEKVVKERVAFLAKEIYQELNGELENDQVKGLNCLYRLQ